MNIEVLKDDPIISGFLWVALAQGKPDNSGQPWSLLHIENEKDTKKQIIVALDRQRMHIIRLDVAYEPGNYKIITQKRHVFRAIPRENCNYPKFLQFIPEHNPEDLMEIQVPNKNTPSYEFNIAISFHSISKSFFNLSLLLDAVSMSKNLIFSCFQKGHFEPLVIKDDQKNWSRMAVIMPVNL
jgi:hypothetical protein